MNDNKKLTGNIFEKSPQPITDSNKEILITENFNLEKSRIELISYTEDKSSIKRKFIIEENISNLNNDNFNYNGSDINNKNLKDTNENNQENTLIKNKKTEKIRYSVSNKFFMMFILCFNFCKTNKDNNNNISLRKRKKIIFENTLEEIRKKFDVVNYLRIFDDLKLIKSLIFEDYQIDIIELINKSKHNYNNILTLTDQNESLKKLKYSNNHIDDKLELALKSKNLI